PGAGQAWQPERLRVDGPLCGEAHGHVRSVRASHGVELEPPLRGLRLLLQHSHGVRGSRLRLQRREPAAHHIWWRLVHWQSLRCDTMCMCDKCDKCDKCDECDEFKR